MPEIIENDTHDEVIQEVRRIKEVLAEPMDFDIDRILADARVRQCEGGRTVVRAPVRE
ncbi:hypothetical protein Pla175_50770 [Pirellulimonas nuda]|uniref:Uncharacterized protein n=1 Tax=Pirellulimonas nuda TaxID=2528009 RepID=A0A518DJJ6_9BACT|nr:hypothetical protein [Pirellulimonas nuda]QDU91647.1 hypothetical protein Pla175_50770 [Pirellulimonas nuda]